MEQNERGITDEQLKKIGEMMFGAHIQWLEQKTIEDAMITAHIWQVETFPKATPYSYAKHLAKEAKELIEEHEAELFPDKNNPKLRKEYGDCLLLALGGMLRAGFNFEEIADVITETVAINKTRQWGEPDSDGVVEHKREGE